MWKSNSTWTIGFSEGNPESSAKHRSQLYTIEVLRWLSTINFEFRHQGISYNRSGRWFLESIEFRNWVSGNASNVLYCCGSGATLSAIDSMR